MEFLKIIEILLRRRWIFAAVFFLFFAIFAAGAFLITPSYQATAKLFIRSSSALTSLMAGLEMAQAIATDSSEDVFETKTALAKISPLLEELISSLQLKDRHQKTLEPDELIKSDLTRKILPQPSIAIKQDEDTAILKITSTSTKPAEAAAMANKLAELYLDYNIKRFQEEFVTVKTFVKNKLTVLHEKYSKSLADLTEFKVKEHAADLATEQDNIISRLKELTKSYEDNEQSLELIGKEIASAAAQLENVGKYRKETAEFARSNELTSLQSKLNELLVSISAKGIVYQKNHPEYQQIEKELETVKELIKKSENITLSRENHGVDPIYDSLSSKLVDLRINQEVGRTKSILLQDIIRKYERKLTEIPAKSAQLAQLELSLSANKTIYESFLIYLNRVEVAEAVALSDTRIVESAEVPKKKKFPKKSVMLALGVFLGLFWGTAAAFFCEYADSSIQSPAALRHLDRFSLLGGIPFSHHLRHRRLLSRLPPDSPLAESYRTVRHNLRFAAADKLAQLLLVTSAGDGEGKSSVAANLALSFAAAQKKTLLIDLNLRRPALHQYFSLKNKSGIADVLQGRLTVGEAVLTTASAGLDILIAGRKDGSPASLIEGKNLSKVLHELRQRYDTVILDSPSLQTSSDALILAAEADGLICVVECGSTALSAAEHAYRRIRQAGISRAGWVLNKCGGGSGRS